MEEIEFGGQSMMIPGAEGVDAHAAFRGVFTLGTATDVEIRILCPDPYLVWLDGKLWGDGPLRYPKDRPEYAHTLVSLPAGKHHLAVHIHHEGVTTRLMETVPPFLAVELLATGRPLPVTWKAAPLPGYGRTVRRLNPQLGWIEWCDTRENPTDWTNPTFDDTKWEPAKAAAINASDTQDETPKGALSPGGRGAGVRGSEEETDGENETALEVLAKAVPAKIPPPKNSPRPLPYYTEGRLADTFGYPTDDPAARFFLRDLAPTDVPPEGVWRRYDLDRVRLIRPRFTLDLPAGTVVEFAYSEALAHGRVMPWINLSAGQSCNLDRYVARGGPQEFMPVTPKGGRFLEVHILGTLTPKFLREEVVERHYHDTPVGSFKSSDGLLDRIWSVGVDTFKACTEDALTDNPTRERGQWTGDVVTVGMAIASAAFGDLRLVRRGLVQSAACAREDGLIAGLCPGGPAFLSTYAAQWVSACLHYVERTGDRTLLTELLPAAVRNLDVFAKRLTGDGVPDDVGWAFVDWGYVRNPGPADLGLNLHVLAAFRDMARWCEAVNDARAGQYRSLGERLTGIARRYFDGERDWERIGLHRAVLGLRLGFFDVDRAKEAVTFVRAHYLRCFPNDTSAPRLSGPHAAVPRLITPYFSHYALAELWERGEGDFVLGQYRTCWGWALEDGRTTWLEVFDPRWSHCHQWSGCPTWQLSRYVLGLRPRFDLGDRTFDFDPKPCALPQAQGRIPLPFGGFVEVGYHRTGRESRWKIDTKLPIRLRIDGEEKRVDSTHEIVRKG